MCLILIVFVISHFSHYNFSVCCPKMLDSLSNIISLFPKYENVVHIQQKVELTGRTVVQYFEDFFWVANTATLNTRITLPYFLLIVLVNEDTARNKPNLSTH